MRMLLLAAAAAFALAGCTTTSIDTAIQQNLPAICTAANTAHVAFVAVSATGKLSDRTVSRERAAYEALAPLCVNPSAATSATVLAAAAAAYATITIALREADRAT